VKKIFLVLMGMALVFPASSLRAEEEMVMEGPRQMRDGQERQTSREWNDSRSRMENSGMKGGMMGGPPQATVVATSDGGVVVLTGPRLVKYDSQMKWVGEADIKNNAKKKPSADYSKKFNDPSVSDSVAGLPAEGEMPVVNSGETSGSQDAVNEMLNEVTKQVS
jgi:hypothetical protein